MKFIILGFVVYMMYRYFRGAFLPPGRRNAPNDHLTSSEKEKEGEYIDYEELD